MNTQRLLALYERVADAPDAVSRLRRFVLDLAVRGKLVVQHPCEGQGSDLKYEIQSERKKLASAAVIKRTKEWPAVSKEEVPFAVPSNWGVVRLGEAMHLINGRAFKPSDWTPDGLPIVRIQNLNKPSAPFNRFNGEVKQRFLVDTGDFLISWSGTPGTSFGAHIWNRGPAILNQHIFKAILIGDAFDSEFLKIAINSRLLELIEQAHGGVGLQHITKPKLEAVALTLPPLGEQRRIVDRFNELMELCCQLEGSRTTREKARELLTDASHARLKVPHTDEATFRAHASFVVDALSALTSRTDQVKRLRQTILNLAVQGKLVKYQEGEGEASSIVELVKLDREEAKTRVRCPDMTLVDFSIPSHWVWQSLDQLITEGPQNGLSPKKTNNVDMPKAITLTATTRGAFNGQHYKHVNVDSSAAAPYWLDPGDLLFQRGNTRDYVGIAAVYDGPPKKFLFPDLIMRVKVSRHMSNRYVHLWCISPFARHYMSTNAIGAQQTMPKINQRVLKSTPVAVPPIDEQYRIVATVEGLMTLCDELENSLMNATTVGQRVLESLLREALEPRGDQREM